LAGFFYPARKKTENMLLGLVQTVEFRPDEENENGRAEKDGDKQD